MSGEDKTDSFPTSMKLSKNDLIDGKKSYGAEKMEIEVSENPDDYFMNRKKRGLAVIINNRNFDTKTGMTDRTGTDVDKQALKQRFKELEFTVQDFTNLTRSDMENMLREAALTIDHTDSDCFICAMLSHGEEGTIYGTDGPIEIERLLQYFKGDKCPSLAGKPKIFFIQACRGTKLDGGVEKPDSQTEVEVSKTVQRIPTEADFLIAYSVVPGYFSWRNSSNGSWFVQAISEVFKKYGKEQDILSLMTKVNRKVAYEFESNASKAYMTNKKQIPCITSMLTHNVYFRPKH